MFLKPAHVRKAGQKKPEMSWSNMVAHAIQKSQGLPTVQEIGTKFFKLFPFYKTVDDREKAKKSIATTLGQKKFFVKKSEIRMMESGAKKVKVSKKVNVWCINAKLFEKSKKYVKK